MSQRFLGRGCTVIASIGSFVLISLFAGTIAKATVNMDFTGPEGNNSGTSPYDVYVYPYVFTINSSANNLLMCDDFDHEITAGEQWPASVLEMQNLNSTNVTHLQYGSDGVQTYLEAGYLFEDEVAAYDDDNSDPRGLYNWAVWDLMTGQDVSAIDGQLSESDETQVQTYLDEAEAAGPSLTPSDFGNVIVYTPTDMSMSGAQEFFGYGTFVPLPEPCTLAGVGIGALCLLGRRQRAKAR
jgi:hypothetical protein